MIDRKRHKADLEAKYRLYFKLLHNKIKNYNIELTNIFNIDEKSF